MSLSIVRHVNLTMKVKCEIILNAEQHGNRAAKCAYGVSEMSIRRWRKIRHEIFNARRAKRTFRSPKTGLYADLEAAVAEYIRQTRAVCRIVSREMICSKAKEEAELRNIEGFWASQGWCDRLMMRAGAWKSSGQTCIQSQ